MGASCADRLPPSGMDRADRPRRRNVQLGGILSNPDAPRVTCFDERVLLFGDTALVLCEEELDGGGTLAASNFFVREAGVWRLAHHHAGQIVTRQTGRRRPSHLN